VTFPVPPFIRVPVAPEPGAFGATRKFDVHTGVDLYVPEGTEVHAVESGRVVSVEDFTGPSAGYPWWHDTQAILVEGASGVLLYGEVTASVLVGETVLEGQFLGRVKRVLVKDKGTPVSMLHFERYAPGVRQSTVWGLGESQPEGLLDPTSLLLSQQG